MSRCWISVSRWLRATRMCHGRWYNPGRIKFSDNKTRSGIGRLHFSTTVLATTDVFRCCLARQWITFDDIGLLFGELRRNRRNVAVVVIMHGYACLYYCPFLSVHALFPSGNASTLLLYTTGSSLVFDFHQTSLHLLTFPIVATG